MKKTAYILVVCSVLLFGCKSETKKKGELSSNDSVQGKDLFEHKATPKYAKRFSVTYHNTYKVVRTDAKFHPNRSSENEPENVQDVMVLVQKGTAPPKLIGGLAHATVISIPVETVAVNVQHSESYLREIGLVDKLNAIGGLYSYNDEMRGKALDGTLGQIGYSWHSPPNFEVLLERKPEVFLMTLASLDHKESLDKCRQFGIPTATVFDWAEPDYLARAEWIKFYSLFFNAEEEASQVFGEIESNIKTLKALTGNLGEKETALWGYYTSKQRWNMNINSVPAQYLIDAGLINALVGNTEPNANGTQHLTTEELLSKGKDVDHWIIGDIHAPPLPKENIMNHFKSWRTGKLYHNMKRVKPKENTSDWYAKAIVRPDMVLKDLIGLAYPDLLPNHTPVFMGYYDKATEGPKELALSR
ncbi:MAG: ABC transporter substrate-binding protein [Bacteroidota bacterium]